jgi:hypothetical protein
VLGTENPADMMTKYLEAVKSQKFSSMLQQVFRDGRAKDGLRVQRSGGAIGTGIIAGMEEVRRNSRQEPNRGPG